MAARIGGRQALQTGPRQPVPTTGTANPDGTAYELPLVALDRAGLPLAAGACAGPACRSVRPGRCRGRSWRACRRRAARRAGSRASARLRRDGSVTRRYRPREHQLIAERVGRRPSLDMAHQRRG